MAAIDVVNRVLREFQRFTGDELPNEPVGAPLPIGDPQSGVHNPKKSELRAALAATISVTTPVERLVVTGGTVNAVQADSVPGGAKENVLVYFIDIPAPNTGNVTISIKGAAPIPVYNYEGDQFAPGEWAGRIFLSNEGASLRAITADPEVIAAAVASVAADAARAEAAAASVGGLNATLFQGRLSLVSGVAIPTADVTGATSIFYMGVFGPYVPVYDGTLFVTRSIAVQLIHALDADPGHTNYHQADRNFDEWVFWDAGTLRLGSGPSWNAGAVAGSSAAGSSARGTGAGSTELELFQGILVNKNAMVVRWGAGAGDTVNVPARRATFVGSFRATANGQATDSVTRRLLSNAYNQAPRLFNELVDATASWPYSTAAWRPANNNANTKAELLFALGGAPLQARLRTKVNNSTATLRTIGSSVYLDGVIAAQDFANVSGAAYEIVFVFLDVVPAAGFHTLGIYEFGGGGDVQTWLGQITRLIGTINN